MSEGNDNVKSRAIVPEVIGEKHSEFETLAEFLSDRCDASLVNLWRVDGFSAPIHMPFVKGRVLNYQIGEDIFRIPDSPSPRVIEVIFPPPLSKPPYRLKDFGKREALSGLNSR